MVSPNWVVPLLLCSLLILGTSILHLPKQSVWALQLLVWLIPTAIQTKLTSAIPANDDATKSVAIITNYIAAAIAEGLAERQASKDDETEGDVDNDAEKRAARLQAEAEAEAARGGRGRGHAGPGGPGGPQKRRVPGGASRRPQGGPVVQDKLATNR